jgi:large repetitive protein
MGKNHEVTIAAGGVILDAVGNNFAGIGSGVYKFGVADTTLPQLSTYAPSQGASGQAVGVSVVLTFGEHIQAGSGNVIITSSGGNQPDVSKVIPAGDAQMTYSGGSMTINPSADLMAVGGKTHTVTMGPGVVKDTSGNGFAGITGTGYQFTVADAVTPTVTRFNPGHATQGLLKTIDIVMTFSENVQRGSGQIQLTPAGGSGVNTPLVIDITDPQVSFMGKQVIINPTNNLLDSGGKTYTIVMPNTVIKDTANNAYAGIAGTNWFFTVTDGTIASIVLYAPPQTSRSASASSSIVLTFNANVQGGTGDVILTPSGGNNLNSIVTIAVGSLAYSGALATIDPPSNLDDRGGKTYTVTAPAGVFVDGFSNPFPALSGNTYVFDLPDTTPPTISTYAPAQAASAQSKSTSIVLTFDENMKFGSGNVVLTPSGGQGGNTPVNIAVPSHMIYINGNVVTIVPPELVDTGAKTYKVESPPPYYYHIWTHNPRFYSHDLQGRDGGRCSEGCSWEQLRWYGRDYLSVWDLRLDTRHCNELQPCPQGNGSL